MPTMEATTLLVSVLLCFLHCLRGGSSLSFSLDFAEPSSNPGASISCDGHAFIGPSELELTRNTRDSDIKDSTGRASYVHKVPLWDGATGEMASFTTTFSFHITPDRDSPQTGDGMAFFLAHFPSKIPPESHGGSLGLLPGLTNGTGDGRIVAVEFDTYLNPQNADISGNHVGIDVNSVNSTASTDTASWPSKNLTSSLAMTATVKYLNVSKMLAVDLKIDDALYQVNATVDLSRWLPEEVAVGFSAATGWAAELHRVRSWSFSSTLEPKKKPATTAPPPGTEPLIPTTSSNKHPNKLRVILLSVLVPLLFLLAVGFLVWRLHCTATATTNEDSDDSDSEEHRDRANLERGVAAGAGPRRYTYHELAAATSNFAEEETLGRGGFGSVYRGHVEDTVAVVGDDQDHRRRRRPVAVKMLRAESSSQGRKEFEAEVRIISRLKHRNLVQLLGWCDSRKGLLLVYELVTEGSLDKHLYSSGTLLTWPQRYKIILGLGSALRYLHGEWEQCVVHGDVKPSNIMLDSSHGTKLGDFGLARLVDHGGGWQTTGAVLGTAGYIDPEFVNTRRPSTESDVYSFGIVLLEIVSGRRPVVETPGEVFTLLRWVWGLYGRGTILDAADERLRGDERWMERVLVVGLWCAHPDRSERPSVAQAMHVLQSDDARLPALPPRMYRTVQDPPVVRGHALSSGYGAYLSIDSSGGARSSVTAGDDTTLSSDSSPTALLRDSSDLA